MKQHSVDNRKREKRNGKKLLLLLLAAVLVTGGVTGAILAKYVSENRQQAEMISANFHISSTYLKEGTTPPQYSIGVPGDLVIDINNYEVENVAQLSQVPMIYTVTVAGGTFGITHGSDTLTATDDHYTFEVNAAADQHILTVTPTADTVTVTVATTSPYVKSLSAVFNRNVSAQPEYTFKDQGDGTARLTIRTNAYAGNITVNWTTTQLAPDTNNLMENWTGGTGTFSAEANSTYSLVFCEVGTPAITPVTDWTGVSNGSITLN